MHFLPEVGKCYQVVCEMQSANFRWYKKSFVGTYLGDQQWNFRPAGGTAQLDLQQVRMISMVETDAPHSLPVSV